MASNTPRRSSRIQKLDDTKKSADSTVSKANKTTDDDKCFSFENDEEFKKVLDRLKPFSEKATELFSSNDVEGKNIYIVGGTSMKKNAMMQKALTIQNVATSSPSTKKIPCIAIPKMNLDEATKPPVKHDGSCNLNLFDESSDNSEEEKESSADEKMITVNSEHENCDDEKESKPVKQNLLRKKFEIISTPVWTRSKSRDFHLKPDEYFATQSEKSVTSNNTLSRLKNQDIDEEKLQKLLANNDHISKVHQERIKEMSKNLEKRYKEWLHILEEGFTVLLYGLGSKRLVINNFHKKMIPDEPTLIINGFFPSLTIKEILDNIIVELLGLETVSNQNECFEIIEKTMKKYPDDRIYLLIHNLDGGMLRSHKAQDTLSRLASIPNIHVLASVDHINTALIWDNVMRAKYNFYWMEATTFLPYKAETSYESSLLVQKSGALALLSLQNVFASLTANAKNIYIALVKYQLEHGGNNYNGMAFKDLYQVSREAFLVSSDQALRAQLTEFIDHKLVRMKRSYDGESLIIPLDNTLLKQFLEQHDVER